MNAAPPFSSRRFHGVAVFDEKMWILGGGDGAGGYKNDIWYSGDGATWTQVTTAAPWAKRDGLIALVFQNKLWILGGAGSGLYNDVWSSSDGKEWTQVTAKAPWSGRIDFNAAAFDNKIWIYGGSPGGETKYGDVWYSPDGANWTKAASSTGWGSRSGMASAVYNNRLWLTCGLTPDYAKDVWYIESTTGIDNRAYRIVPPDRIQAAWPNPFRNHIQIRILKSRSTPAKIDIFNSAGQKIPAVLTANGTRGGYTAIWNGMLASGAPAPGGTYIVKYETGGSAATRTIVKSDRP